MAELALVVAVAEMGLVAAVAEMARVAPVDDVALVATVAELALLLRWLNWLLLLPSCSRCKIVVTKYHLLQFGIRHLAPANLPQLHILFCRPRVST